MPHRALRPCTEYPCRALVQRGRCAAHQKQYEQRDRAHRGTAGRRGYDLAWRKATAGFLQLHPWCARCARANCRTRSELVGHIVPVNRAPERRLDPSNWEALCRSCNAMQAREDNHV